ncbi:MAG: DUF2125 domain-containing protein [Rhizomicrobium sp.]
MRYSSRLFLYAPLLVVLILAIAAGLRWHTVAGGLEQWLIQSNGHEIAPGVRLRFGSEKISGFPFNVDAMLDNVTLETNGARGPIVWRTERFAIHELTFGRVQQIYEAAGTQGLSWTGSDGRAHRFTFVPGSLQASAIESGGRLVRFDLDINGIGSRDLSGARVQLHFRKAPGRDAIDVACSADDLRLSPGLQAGFGARIERLTVRGSLAPAARVSSLFSGGDEWRGAAEKWRHGRGVFHLDRFAITWGGLSAQGTGKLMLDNAHRLEGDLHLIVTGAKTLPAAKGADTPLAHAIAELAQTAPSAGNARLDISIDLRDGNITVRRAGASQLAFPAGRIGPLY